MNCVCPAPALGLYDTPALHATIPDEVQAQLIPLGRASGGAYVFFKGDDGQCWGWTQIMGSGGGTAAWAAIRVLNPLIVPAPLACAMAKLVNTAPYTPVTLDLNGSAWKGRFHVNYPWHEAPVAKPIRTAVFNAATTPFLRFR